jgi:hypothetical protein
MTEPASRNSERTMQERSLEISLKPAYRKFNYIYIPVENTGFFPPGTPKTKTTVEIDTDTGLIKADLQYNSKAHV